MAKDYNIDDILLEVKKRKEENENKIKSGVDFTDEVKHTEQKKITEPPKTEKASEVNFIKPEKKAEPKPIKKEPVIKNEPKPKTVEKVPETDEKKAEAQAPQSKAQAPQSKAQAPQSKAQAPKQEAQPKKEAEQKISQPEAGKKVEPKAEEEKPLEPIIIGKPKKIAVQENKNDGYVDISSFSADKGIEEYPEESDIKPKKNKNKNKKKKKGWIIFLCILLVILIAAGVGTWLYVDHILDHVSSQDDTPQATEEVWTGMDKLVESFEPIEEADASQIASLKEMIKKWYYNGTPCSSSHVLNIMLIGEDGYDPDEESRADSAIIASINVDTKKITLTSVLRDTYAYWETEPGNEESGQFGKINGAKSSGDIKTYINAIENLYKIKIDNYATVDFESFKTIIDTLGGVEIEITSAEINEINNDQKTYDGTWIDKTFDGDSGVMKLTGQQALAYCRIRHLDSDNVRADRQKQCLTQIFNGIKDASSVKLLKIINDIVPYIKTDMSRDMLLKIAKYAISQGWTQYSVITNTVPNSRINENGAGGRYYGAWCWKSDFPQDAYNLQTMLYGKSSITLARTRVDVIKCRESGYMSDGYGPVGATIINEHYGEASTLPETTSDESDDSSSNN